MPGSSENLPSAATVKAGWGTLSAGAQLGAKLGAKKPNASMEAEAWQPPEGAETCKSELCCWAPRGRGGPAGAFSMQWWRMVGLIFA